jgi:hypothetical protein
VNIDSERPTAYQLGCSYRTEEPTNHPAAPYRLWQRIIPTVHMHSKAEIRVGIIPNGRASRSQVVARIGLPGGCMVDAQALDQLVENRTISYWDVNEGFLNLYWARPISSELQLTLPVHAEIAGRFEGRPSIIYPYYESNREHHAPPLRLKVLNTFGAKVELEDLIRPDGSRRRPGGRAIDLPPQGRGVGPGHRPSPLPFPSR